jgi:hypothetical protein
VAKVVEPKRAKLREAQTVLATANAALAEKQAALAEVEARVQALQRQLAEAQQAQKDLAAQVGRAGLAAAATMAVVKHMVTCAAHQASLQHVLSLYPHTSLVS